MKFDDKESRLKSLNQGHVCCEQLLGEKLIATVDIKFHKQQTAGGNAHDFKQWSESINGDTLYPFSFVSNA